MPIYEYRCVNCGNVFELLTGAGGIEEIPACEKCGGEAFQKLLSSSNFTIKSSSGGAAASTRCCGADAPRGDCVPGMCCGIADKKDI